MFQFGIAYLAAACAFLGTDVLWLNRAMGFYRHSLGDMLAEKPNLAAAALYPILVGIVVFAVLPAIRNVGWTAAMLLGGAARAGRLRDIRDQRSPAERRKIGQIAWPPTFAEKAGSSLRS